MTPWKEFTAENIESVPESLGVFLLARGEGNISYVGRADQNLRTSMKSFLNAGYTHFQWVKVPWEKEAYEMQCRLYHHEGGRKKLDNKDHPISADPRHAMCSIACVPSGLCEA